MVKQKLSNKEEAYIAEQLKQFIKPKTLPDIIRKAILNNKWIPDKYQIYIPKGDIDDRKSEGNTGDTTEQRQSEIKNHKQYNIDFGEEDY